MKHFTKCFLVFIDTLFDINKYLFLQNASLTIYVFIWLLYLYLHAAVKLSQSLLHTEALCIWPPYNLVPQFRFPNPHQNSRYSGKRVCMALTSISGGGSISWHTISIMIPLKQYLMVMVCITLAMLSPNYTKLICARFNMDCCDKD